MLNVIALTRDDIVWPFNGEPYLRIGTAIFKHSTFIDPFPCYSHDTNLTLETLRTVYGFFPVGIDVTIFTMPVEGKERTNGWTQHGFDREYDEDQKKYVKSIYKPSIGLSGKRIPPHPAMTRYLVAHEYGHIVSQVLAEEENKLQDFYREYEQVRGLPTDNERRYGGGTWDISTGEIFANDFRILVCGIENEFWPHPIISYPTTNDALVKWWRDTTTNWLQKGLT